MKEHTFLEAVEILKEGKCEKIMPTCWFRDGDGYTIKEKGVLSTTLPSGTGIRLGPKFFLGKWKCIGMKPRTEERKIEYFLLIWKEGAVTFQKEYPLSLLECGSIQQAIPLSYTYTFTFPEED